jgi:hypothetical protein
VTRGIVDVDLDVVVDVFVDPPVDIYGDGDSDVDDPRFTST